MTKRHASPRPLPCLPDLGLPDLPAAQVAGIDEAGRGCLAGPVVAAACILPDTFDLPGLTDSKALTAARRDQLAAAIRTQALCWSLGLAWAPEIDRVNILQATLRSMERAVAHLRLRPALLLIDGNQTCLADIPQRTVIGGDALVPAISAASILAKTFRDHLLAKLDRRYPGYGLAIHKGYGTAAHLDALQRLGPSSIHRLTFRGVRPEPPAKTKQERQSCLPGIST
ncbi:MAG: ribonuclease HII [Humidesulfovibrio sp.]|uniref:ribonuclease HII n=1 Tax=Humidesulfovibrio sp. TaxID=2910988 RepID=UPI0027FB92C0|nr:ribonuclease HII [Humidesulfovibrio sp.]MDQ7836135.1 ribonuclease HII [Humidesulfovibrio sp.]